MGHWIAQVNVCGNGLAPILAGSFSEHTGRAGVGGEIREIRPKFELRDGNARKRCAMEIERLTFKGNDYFFFWPDLF